ncbi:hypothetical protein HRbin36_00776 [bacterium HR36]|nr:hypothetical protein HRbin36_00776 [bacterium HR36]
MTSTGSGLVVASVICALGNRAHAQKRRASDTEAKVSNCSPAPEPCPRSKTYSQLTDTAPASFTQGSGRDTENAIRSREKRVRGANRVGRR